MGVVGKSTKSIAHGEATVVGSKHLDLFKTCLGIGPQGVDDCPQFQTVLKPSGCQNLADNLRSESVSRAAPECCKTKLGVGVEKGFLENTPFWMEELANEWEVEFGLPLLDQSHLETTKVCSVGVEWDGSPNV